MNNPDKPVTWSAEYVDSGFVLNVAMNKFKDQIKKDGLPTYVLVAWAKEMDDVYIERKKKSN